MSGREDRSSESKRRHSRLHREPSPRRSRRDGRPQTERLNAERQFDKDGEVRDHEHRHRLQDPLPFEAQKVVSKESENRIDRHQGGSKHSSAPSKVPQSRSYFKHDDHGSWQNGRSFSHRTENERGWWRDFKEQQNDRGTNKTVSSDTRQKDEKAKDIREDNHVRRHDPYFEAGANPKFPERKRPPFREQKLLDDSEKTNKSAADLDTPNPQNHPVDNRRRDERGHTHRHSEKPERRFAGDRELNKAQTWRGNFSSKDRYGDSSRNRGRDGFAPRQVYRPTGSRVEKWKHDLYDEANKSPTPKNEEDQISKIEALLAS